MTLHRTAENGTIFCMAFEIQVICFFSEPSFELCFGFDGTFLLKFKSDVTIHSYRP